MGLPKKIPENKELGTLISEAFLNTNPNLLKDNDSEYSGEAYKED